jgi:hypothetical protein
MAATKRSTRADPWEGLFRAATTFTEAPTGAEKSVGHGGSPKGSRLRLAPWIAPTPRMTSVPRGRLKAWSPFPVAVSSETSPWVGYMVQTKSQKPPQGAVSTLFSQEAEEFQVDSLRKAVLWKMSW